MTFNLKNRPIPDAQNEFSIEGLEYPESLEKWLDGFEKQERKRMEAAMVELGKIERIIEELQEKGDSQLELRCYEELACSHRGFIQSKKEVLGE